jgi:2-polyprenyl-6-methoxyphenol hydroxylase-like FAD-dependent oxidoreductase
VKPARESEALVVGAGPVGLVTALSLVDHDIGVQVIDEEWRGASHSYALALHPGSLRLLHAMGVGESILERGRRIDRLVFYESDEPMGEIDLTEVGGRFPFALVVPQNVLESVLVELLEARGGKVLWNHRLSAMTPESSSVKSRVARMEKTSGGYPIAHTEWNVAGEYDVASSFVVGADGYHSYVRKALGSRFEHRGDAETFSVFEFPCDLDLENEARVVFHRGTTNVLWPLPEGRARFSFEVPQSEPALPTLEALTGLLRSRAPWFPPPAEIAWTATALFERRVVDRFGDGRVWLAGDAAHVTGPVGAQSMNIGLREALDLADAIATAVDDRDVQRAFAAYGAERSAEWHSLLAARMQCRDDASPWARRRAAAILPCVPASGADLYMLLRQIGLSLDVSS